MKRTLLKMIIGLVLLLPLVPKAQQPIASQFSFALSDSTQLGLTAAQIRKLKLGQKKLADSIGLVQAYPDSIQFNRAAYESRMMDAIINNKQYLQVLTKKNKPLADVEARAKWEAAVAKQEDDLYIKDSVLPKLTSHLLTSRNIHDRYAHNKTANDSALQIINNHVSEAVTALATGNAFLGTLPNAKLTQVLENRKSFGLTQQQILKLLSTDRDLRKKVDSTRHNLMDTAAHFNWGRFDNSNLQALLTPAQISQLMLLRHQDNAKKTAADKWKTAVANNATGNYNQRNATKQLTDYYLQYNILQDMYSGNRMAMDSAISVFIQQTPDSLHVLISGHRYWGADTAGLVGTALLNQQVLGLRNSLADSLLVQARWELRQDKLAWKYRDSLKFSRSFYEATLLPQVLTDSQYTKLLTIYFRPDALKAAQKNWQQLSALGLTTAYNQDTTVSAIAAYNLQHSSIETRYATDEPTKKRKLRQLDLTMPAALALLKHAEKSGASKTSTGTYVW